MFTTITSPNAPKAIGPYSPAVKLGDFVYMSGQLPLDPESNEIVAGGIQEQTYQVLKNMEAILAEMGLETRHIVKTTVFMTDLADFDSMNQIYATYFMQPTGSMKRAIPRFRQSTRPNHPPATTRPLQVR